MHYFNVTSAPILREFWLNLYLVPSAQVTEVPNQIRGMGGFSWTRTPIPPFSHNVYSYECPIQGDGRIVTLLGHTHAHGIRETAWIRRVSGERQKVFQQFDYLDPKIFHYNTVTANPPVDAPGGGAHTGQLQVANGDVLEWECEVNNDSEFPLRYVNDVQQGEMCNIWGSVVGAVIDCRLP
jgi:hypothetical protein